MSRFIKGMDLSTLLELERCGAKYYDHGKERDILDIMRDYDVDTIRLRLWNDPYSETGEPYGAGCNDLAETIAIGKKVSDAGFGVLLNFHYSDFWADPGKQIKPKAWKDFDADQLEQAVYEFTEDSLRKVLEAGVNVTMIQVGNEVTNGLLWPEGLKPNYDNIARFISSGIRACRAVKPEIPLMIHLDNGGNNEMYRDWFDHYMERGEDFDYIGLSYYPFWHGTLQMLEDNMNDMAARYGKELIVAEVSMGYTMEDYKQYEKLKKYCFTCGGLSIHPAESEIEMINEGRELHHCVATYATRHANGRTAIFFIRHTNEPDKPYFTLEYSFKYMRVMQNRGYHNADRTEEVKKFEKQWVEFVKEVAGVKEEKERKVA